MMKVALLLSFIGSAAAFAPNSQPNQKDVLRDRADALDPSIGVTKQPVPDPSNEEEKVDKKRGVSFEIYLSKETFKFNGAHFVAFPGFRERLHGHNYRASVRLIGNRIGTDGYLLDFGDVKKVVTQTCKDMNENFLLPMLSDVLQIDVEDNEGKHGNVHILCEDGSRFSIPVGDCYMLPIVHSTSEELAVYMWGKILLELDPKYLVQRGIHTLEVTCIEAVGQEAIFRHEIPKSGEKEDIQQIIDLAISPAATNGK